jgi:hypothetical protein
MDAATLKSLLVLNSATGEFIWKARPGIARNDRAGKIAGKKRKDGYVDICINRKLYLAHRLVWLYVYGNWPPHQIDHINRDRTNNRIHNLRLATPAQNAQNRTIAKNNKSGFTGVFLYSCGKHGAFITKDKKRIYLGLYDTLEEARQVRSNAQNSMFTHAGAL